MFLKKNRLYKEVPILLGISTYAYLVNWYSGNMGVIPIDSFGFLDTGYSIIQGHLPIRDFWIFTGLVVDYMEAAFLYLFGNNWNSHLAHSSFMNIVATTSLYLFLKEYKVTRTKNSFLYIYHYFIDKFHNADQFNLDDESLFLEFKLRLLNG